MQHCVQRILLSQHLNPFFNKKKENIFKKQKAKTENFEFLVRYKIWRIQKSNARDTPLL